MMFIQVEVTQIAELLVVMDTALAAQLDSVHEPTQVLVHLRLCSSAAQLMSQFIICSHGIYYTFSEMSRDELHNEIY